VKLADDIVRIVLHYLAKLHNFHLTGIIHQALLAAKKMGVTIVSLPDNLLLSGIKTIVAAIGSGA